MCVTNRKVPEFIIMIFSGFILLMSFVMVLLAIKFNNSGITGDLGEIDDYTNQAFVGLLLGAFIALFIGIFGLCTKCCKHRCHAVLFGCFLLPAASFVFICGFSIATISNTDEATLRQFCSDDPNYESENHSKYVARARTAVEKLDETMNTFVSQQMCSKNCPCNAKDHEEYVTQWTEMSESDVNKFGRTHLDQADNMVPLVWVYVETNEDVYDNFLDCFNAIEAGTA